MAIELQQKILVVDDDEKNLEILSIILSEAYDVKTATSGEEALRIHESFKPDIMLLDIMMLGIDGYEVCRVLRLEKKQRDIKIILVTAKTGIEDKLKGYEVGANDYITKPFDEDELLAKIKVFASLCQEEKKSEQLNRCLLLRQQDIPNTLWESDSDLNFSWVEDTCETLLGYSPATLQGKPISDFLAKEEIGEFYFKFKNEIQQLNPKIAGLTFNFIKSSGEKIPLQVFADSNIDSDKNPAGMTGIFRDMSSFSKLVDVSDESSQHMMIRVDQHYIIVHVGKDVHQFLPVEIKNQESTTDFLQFLVDPSMSNLFSFSFDQKEDVPFPVEVNLTDDNKIVRSFSVQFTYNPDGPYQEGYLAPISAKDKLDIASHKMNSQDKTIADQQMALKSALVIDPEMQESILTDAQNLSSEILDLIKSLEVFAFPSEETFSMEEYSQFLLNRNLQVYLENLRLLGNKIHGLKGSCGFLLQPAKVLCHHIEDITTPLAEKRFILTQSLSRLMKQFIFKIEEMLEKFESASEFEFNIDGWLEKIASAINTADEFINDNKSEVIQLIDNRSKDSGEIRNRKKKESLTVSYAGYETLAEKVKDLFFTLSTSLNDEESIQAGNLYNDFLGTHQQIKKVPLNLSRYDRLIPQIAKDYQKEADFHFKDHQVKADQEFWNSIHEILNHVLKNAVIHGIENPEKRVEQKKDAKGNISVELKEDALHILLIASDDGQGIDTKKLAEKAINSKILNAEQLKQMTEDDIIRLLFLQGISTVDSLDDNAGRGVGMNAVQEVVDQLKGEVQIVNEPGKGCTYEFSFQKSNVSLPCIIISIDDLELAFPEDYVETFIDYKNKNIVTVKQKPFYKYNDSLIPLIDSRRNFDKDATGNSDIFASVMVLKSKHSKKALLINKILHHANLPILSLPKIYRGVPIYQGTTIFNKNPVQVINIEGLE